MLNLNDILKNKAEFYLGNSGIEYETRLGDRFQELDDKRSIDYSRAFGELYGEVVDLRPLPTKARITSKLEDNAQKVWIEHNGTKIKDDILGWLNRNLERIERNLAIFTTPGRHGNLRAAQILKQYGGKIRIFNISDGEYNVQTKVEIPINTPPIP